MELHEANVNVNAVSLAEIPSWENNKKTLLMVHCTGASLVHLCLNVVVGVFFQEAGWTGFFKEISSNMPSKLLTNGYVISSPTQCLKNKNKSVF